MKQLLPLLLLLPLFVSCKEEGHAQSAEPFRETLTLQVADSTQSVTKEQLKRCASIFEKRLHRIGHPLAQLTASDSNSISFGLYKKVRPDSLPILLSMDSLTFQLLASPSLSSSMESVIRGIDSVLYADYQVEKELNPSSDDSLQQITKLIITSEGWVLCKKSNIPLFEKLTLSPSVQYYLNDSEIMLSYTPQSLRNPPRGMYRNDSLYVVYHVDKAVKIDHSSIKAATREENPQWGGEVVSLSFSPEGSKKFERVTEANIGKQLAITIGNRVVSAPTINEKISGGNAQISGNFTKKESKKLATILHSGKLPIRFAVKKETEDRE